MLAQEQDAKRLEKGEGEKRTEQCVSWARCGSVMTFGVRSFGELGGRWWGGTRPGSGRPP